MDDLEDVFVVWKPGDADLPVDTDLDYGGLGQIYGLCRSREVAQALSDRNPGTEIHRHAYVAQALGID